MTVTDPAGTSHTNPADRFTYDAPTIPDVESVSPNSGPASGGTTVTINGSGFTGATEVHFGSAAASGVVVVNDSTITASSPRRGHRRCDGDGPGRHLGRESG